MLSSSPLLHPPARLPLSLSTHIFPCLLPLPSPFCRSCPPDAELRRWCWGAPAEKRSWMPSSTAGLPGLWAIPSKVTQSIGRARCCCRAAACCLLTAFAAAAALAAASAAGLLLLLMLPFRMLRLLPLLSPVAVSRGSVAMRMPTCQTARASQQPHHHDAATSPALRVAAHGRVATILSLLLQGASLAGMAMVLTLVNNTLNVMLCRRVL